MTLLNDEFEPSERRYAKGSLSDSHLREARVRPVLSLSISSVLVWRGAVGWPIGKLISVLMFAGSSPCSCDEAPISRRCSGAISAHLGTLLLSWSWISIVLITAPPLVACSLPRVWVGPRLLPRRASGTPCILRDLLEGSEAARRLATGRAAVASRSRLLRRHPARPTPRPRSHRVRL